jgi:hypothetical protein
MPRGSKPGERRGGRKKGAPNKITAETRQLFQMVYEARLSDLDRWIRETGDGFQAVHFLADGTAIPYTEKNPGKAADILTRMAEHFVPKLGRLEVSLTQTPAEQILAELERRAALGPGSSQGP